MEDRLIPTYIINLKHRPDRRQHALNEFSGRNEFDVHVVDACQHAVGAVGLWKTIKNIIELAVSAENKFVLICEDDHQFTESYSIKLLLESIEEGQQLKADIICGGVSSFTSAIPISDKLFWVENFCGLQFTIVFQSLFQSILKAQFSDGDAADLKISELTNNKYFIYEFISIQKAFGYSDVTGENNREGRVSELFKRSLLGARILKDVTSFYRKTETFQPASDAFDDVILPTYIINLAERSERKTHIEQEFHGKSEFAINIVEACKHPIGSLGLWQSIRKIVALAIQNDEDVIIICEDDHEFSKDYSKKFLLKNIIEAYQQGADILLGGISNFERAVPISSDRFWINTFFGTQFVVVFRKLFQAILDEPFDDTVTADGVFADLAVNKMVLYPFISTQKYFGYSDVNAENSIDGHIEQLFTTAARRLGQFPNPCN